MADVGGGHVEGTTPYAWPFDGNLGGAGTAVLVVRPRGPVWDEVGAARVASAAADIASAVESAGGSVVTVVTAPPGRSEVADVAADLPAGKIAVEAQGIDGFYGSSLEAVLRAGGFERLVLVGYGAETCVHSTMRSANDRGFECLFVSDACLAYDPALTPRTVSMIEMSGGIFGAVGTADAVVAAYTNGRES